MSSATLVKAPLWMCKHNFLSLMEAYYFKQGTINTDGNQPTAYGTMHTVEGLKLQKQQTAHIRSRLGAAL